MAWGRQSDALNVYMIISFIIAEELKLVKSTMEKAGYTTGRGWFRGATGCQCVVADELREADVGESR